MYNIRYDDIPPQRGDAIFQSQCVQYRLNDNEDVEREGIALNACVDIPRGAENDLRHVRTRSSIWFIDFYSSFEKRNAAACDTKMISWTYFLILFYVTLSSTRTSCATGNVENP